MLKFLVGSTLLSAVSCNAVRLFAADSGGNVTSLSLTGSDSNYTLAATSKTTECQVNPSWLTLDSANRVLYCLDRGGSASTSGSLNSFSIEDDGTLSHIDRVDAPLSGVAGDIFRLSNSPGDRVYISASYNRSTAAVYALGAAGDLPGSEPLQQIFPVLNETGPVTSRQDRSYLHHVIKDPKHKYAVIPDLGGDRVRVYAINEKNGLLTEVDGLVADPGTGPRHGVFLTKNNGEIYFFFNGELSQRVYSYRVTYEKSGLGFEKVFDIPSISADLPATKAPTSEIALSPDNRFVIVSNREKSFRDSPIVGSGPSDTLSTFAIKHDGTLERVQLAPSGGWSPRQFSINKAGDKLAVGHENNSTVIIWKRDVASGKIVTEEEGGKLAQITLSSKVVSTIWDE